MAAASASTSMLCVLIVICNLLSTSCNANYEVDALIDVKRMILQDPLNALQTWDPSSPNPCNWKHVGCDPYDNVNVVDLKHQKLYGALSPRIGDLQSLWHLALFNNSFFGSLPTNLGNLKNLSMLQLQRNKFSGQIPQSLGQLSSLDILNLQFNQLSGRVPINGALSKFGHFSFYGNPDLCGDVVAKKCPKRSLYP